MPDALKEFSKRWNKKSGEIAFDPTDARLAPVPVSLDMPAVDMILGGGVPRGRITVVVGQESSGKTLLSQLIIAAAQRRGGTCIFIDNERTFDERWFRLTGVDTNSERLLVLRPTTLEQTFDAACDALVSVQPDVLVLDSIAALVPQDMLKKDMEDKDFRGLAARKITEGVKKLTQFNRGTAVVLINQLRIDMGVKFGNPETMPGGRGLRHAASLIIRTRQGKWLTTASEGEGDALDSVDDEKEARRIGFLLRLRTEKSKVTVPYQTCDLKFYFTGEVDPLGSLVHLALQRGVIVEPVKAYFELPGVTSKVHGRAAVEELLRDNEELRTRIIEAVKER